MPRRRGFALAMAATVLLFTGCSPQQATTVRDPLAAEPQRSTPTGMLLVSPDNFVRSASDTQFLRVVDDNGFGRFTHYRDVTPVDHQPVVRPNRDTLYSAAVFDLQAAPVTITLPDPGERFMSAQVINQDEYVTDVFYGKGEHTIDQKRAGTRYALVAVRILVDPKDPADLAAARGLQDALTVGQDSAGTFEIPRWDPASQQKVRDALLTLAETVPDSRGMFGAKDDVDPIRHLVGAASAWGGNPDKDALYLHVTPARNDGRTVYRLTVTDVPTKAFWSVSVYNKDGYFAPNPQHAYSVNDITATTAEDGSVTIQFGGCTGGVPNCLPTLAGWNYLVRMYRPGPQILAGTWRFPEAQPVR